MNSFKECGADEIWDFETIESATDTRDIFESEVYASRSSATNNPLAELPADAIYVKNSIRAYVEGEAWLRKPDSYGHLGTYKRQLIFRSIDVIREATPEDIAACQ